MTESVAATVRQQVLASTDRFWAVEDFGDDGHPVVSELGRLVTKGELERVRRGLYWRGRKTRFGMAQADAVKLVGEVVGPREAVGAAGWYATNLLGLSTQVAPKAVVAVSRRPPRVDRVRLVDRSNRTGRRDQQLNELEVTILEVLEGWDKYVEVPHDVALERLSELMDRSDIRIDRLVNASETESARVRERLRAILLSKGLTAEASRVPRARSESAKVFALEVVPSRATS